MPTVNPRIAITVLPHRHDLLKRLAALQGVSMAALVSELLDEFYPVLERVCVALEMAQHAQDSSKTGIREAAAKAEADIAPMVASSLDQLDLFLQKMQDTIHGENSTEQTAPETGAPCDTGFGVGCSNGSAAEGLSPRVVTRGSGTKTGKPLKPVKASRSKASKGIAKGADQK